MSSSPWLTVGLTVTVLWMAYVVLVQDAGIMAFSLEVILPPPSALHVYPGWTVNTTLVAFAELLCHCK